VSERYLLDTNVLSEPAKERPNAVLSGRLHSFRGKLVTAAPALYEMIFGYERLPPSRKRDTYQSYLETQVIPFLPVLAYDQSAAEWHARERARLARLGRTPSHVDGQIAAIAAVNRCVLVTRNLEDFKDFRGLRVEDWFTE
jgi:tRNA(fMet)-specific endonuclease VapC